MKSTQSNSLHSKSFSASCPIPATKFPEYPPEEFILRDDEVTELARLGLLFGVDLQDDRLDRVFLNRAIEHILARRFLRENQGGDSLRSLLKHLAQESWVANPYGLDQSGDEEEQGEEAASEGGAR